MNRLNPKTLAVLFGNESIISTSKKSDTSRDASQYTQKTPNAKIVFAISEALRDQEPLLREILGKSEVLDQVSISILRNLQQHYNELEEAHIVYFYTQDEFDSKFNFKTFKKGSKSLTICPDIQSIMEDAAHKTSLWKNVIKPLTL